MIAVIRLDLVSNYLAPIFKIKNTMKIILFLIIISLCVAGGFLFAFFWAVKDGQYEDDFTPSMRILVDDDMLLPIEVSSTVESNQSNQSKQQ
jgi:cbb3-type cytochrome oxidase maturation protein